jgi:hypothetical protein
MTTRPQPPTDQDQRPAGAPPRRNRLAVTAATFAVFALLMTISSLTYKPGPEIRTDYAAGRFGTPALLAIIALACGIPALLRIRRPADQDGRSWDGKEPAIVSVAAAYFVIVVAAVRITMLLASR